MYYTMYNGAALAVHQLGDNQMKLNSKQFTYNKKDNKFIAEVSDLETKGQNVFSPNGTGGQGLTLVSQWTGEESVWDVTSCDRSNDEDYELTAWNLRPTRESQKIFPKLRTATMVIFND